MKECEQGAGGLHLSEEDLRAMQGERSGSIADFERAGVAWAQGLCEEPTPTTDLDFGQALAAMRAGKRVMLPGEPAFSWTIKDGRLWFVRDDGHSFPERNFIAEYLLARDWQIVGDGA